MAIRRFALIYGIVFLLAGIAGFVPGLLQPLETGHPELTLDSGAGRLLGLFPVNVLHNLVHVLFGIWGLVAQRSVPASIAYARAVAVIYAILLVMGLIPGLETTFGLIPLWGHDVWLHGLLAAVAAYFGFVARADTGAAAHA
jgi:hypothetical protein